MPDNDFEKVYGFVTDIIRKTYDTAVLAETRLTSDGHPMWTAATGQVRSTPASRS
jgi:hypothetical protein